MKYCALKNEGYIVNSIQKLLKRYDQKSGNDLSSNSKGPQKQISQNLKENVEFIKERIGNSSDFVIRDIFIGKQKIPVSLFFTDGLVNDNVLDDFILKALIKDLKDVNLEQQKLIDFIKEQLLPIGEISEVHNMKELISKALSGDTVILTEGQDKGLVIDTRGWQDRGIQEPTTQTSVRGPKDSFTETLRTNTALIRRRIKDSNLWIDSMVIGQRTETDIAIAYIHNIANEKIVEEVKTRLGRINVDAILESGNIEEMIQDETYSPFPTIYHTERPDTIAAGLLEGRIAILIDGTPIVLLVPALFIQYFHASEDHYHRFDLVIAVRLLRLLSFFITLLTPAAYIAVTTFHQEMLPTPLLISLSAQREGIPFPAFLEAFIMMAIFEILHEAGIRLPRAVGSAISIVGALVLGEAAVQAGLVSPVMVIIVSLTAISNFVIPSFDLAISIRMLRFALMILAAVYGLFGIILGLVIMVLHLCSLRSFGVPYMSPFAPFVKEDQKDAVIRLPQWKLLSRPHYISEKNKTRKGYSKPEKPN